MDCTLPLIILERLLYYYYHITIIHNSKVYKAFFMQRSNLVSTPFCFRGSMDSEKGPGFGWYAWQSDWSMILNVIHEPTARSAVRGY